VIFPIEGGRWIVTLGGSCKDYPPTDEAGFLAFARSLPVPEFAKALESAEPLGPIVGHRSTENRLRHYERLTCLPNRFLVTGDAACAFNPVYGQGMTTAGLGAEVLDECLQACRPAGRLDGLSQRFQKRLAQSNSVPWTLSTSEDFRHRETEGNPPGRTVRFLHRYLDYVIGLGVEDRTVRKTMLEVFHLIRPPSSLLHPKIASRALWRMALGRPVTSAKSTPPTLQGDSAGS
jgi:flavin-dependent dehydrogenase